MVNGGGIGGFGGGGLKHPRQWLGVRSCPEPSGAERGGAGAELGYCQGSTLTTLRRRGMPGTIPVAISGALAVLGRLC
eukprot:scaffold59025_cov53-Phaeocystis_antarctica.AAC.3